MLKYEPANMNQTRGCNLNLGETRVTGGYLFDPSVGYY